jgi:hypothetical protein
MADTTPCTHNYLILRKLSDTDVYACDMCDMWFHSDLRPYEIGVNRGRAANKVDKLTKESGE